MFNLPRFSYYGIIVKFGPKKKKEEDLLIYTKAFTGEHLWPRSYGLTNGPSLTDLHNIRPADVNGKESHCSIFY